MNRIETSLRGVCIIEPRIFSDSRGAFFESYHQAKFRNIGIRDEFVQDNHSQSVGGVLRGLHYQLNRPQAKLCRVIEGRALDVAIDIRVGSPTFGKWASAILTAEESNMIYIPRGFAHGFLALSESVQFLYKCSDFYDASDEHGIIWNDPELGISWGIERPLLSEKDTRFPQLSGISREALPRYSA
jgi:dTDP-4-dehydrorhamnose 3,5-epimerase